MTPKEKAKELIEKFMIPALGQGYEAQQCALILCDEILGYMGADRGTEFWTEVKKEIENVFTE